MLSVLSMTSTITKGRREFGFRMLHSLFAVVESNLEDALYAFAVQHTQTGIAIGHASLLGDHSFLFSD